MCRVWDARRRSASRLLPAISNGRLAGMAAPAAHREEGERRATFARSAPQTTIDMSVRKADRPG
jgi:hypothetical protein